LPKVILKKASSTLQDTGQEVDIRGYFSVNAVPLCLPRFSQVGRSAANWPVSSALLSAGAPEDDRGEASTLFGWSKEPRFEGAAESVEREVASWAREQDIILLAIGL
jgi:hypothetical protein